MKVNLSSKGNYVFGEKTLGSIKSSFYVSLSVFGRLAVLVGLFLSCLKKQCVFVTKQLQLYNFKWAYNLYCGKHTFYFLFLRTCWQSSKFTTNHLCLTLRFPSTDAGVLLSHCQPSAARLCQAGRLQWASSHVLGEPNAKCGKTLWEG